MGKTPKRRPHVAPRIGEASSTTSRAELAAKLRRPKGGRKSREKQAKRMTMNKKQKMMDSKPMLLSMTTLSCQAKKELLMLSGIDWKPNPEAKRVQQLQLLVTMTRLKTIRLNDCIPGAAQVGETLEEEG